MAEKNPLEPLLDQIAQILKTFEENKDKAIVGEPTDQDIADIINITNRAAALEEAFEIAKKEQGLTDQEISKTARENWEDLPEKDKRLLKKIEMMQREAENQYEAISRSMKQARKKKIKSGHMFKKGKKGKSERSLHISFRRGWKKM